eukprot:291192_1
MADDDNKDDAWNSYKKDNNARPKNASQLMKWTKKNEHCKTLSFSEAKKIYNVRSQEKEDNFPIIIQPKSNVDMTAEKEELKEYIGECKEELVGLQQRELSMEDDYEECMEELELKFEQIEALLKKTKEDIINHRKSQYQVIANAVKSQKETLDETLKKLKLTLAECDIKGDKEEVKKVLSAIPQLEEIEEYAFSAVNIDPITKLLENVANEALKTNDDANDDK